MLRPNNWRDLIVDDATLGDQDTDVDDDDREPTEEELALDARLEAYHAECWESVFGEVVDEIRENVFDANGPFQIARKKKRGQRQV
jgi:hypothetical protein